MEQTSQFQRTKCVPNCHQIMLCSFFVTCSWNKQEKSSFCSGLCSGLCSLENPLYYFLFSLKEQKEQINI